MMPVIEIDKKKLELAAYFAAGAFIVWVFFALLDMGEELQETVAKEAFSKGYQEGLLYATSKD